MASLRSGYLGAGLNANLGEYAISDGRGTTEQESYVLNKISVSRPQETEIVGSREQNRGQKDEVSIRSTNRVSNDGLQEFIILRKTIDYQISYNSYKNGEDQQQRKERAVEA